MAVFHLLFFLSGAAALGHQIIWSRMFTTGLGHEMPAVLAVVAAIFAGMAFGAHASQRFLSASSRPGRWYGWLELLIGLWAVGAIWLIPLSNRAASWLIGLDAAPLRHWVVVFLIPGLALLPATAAMGATFPAIEQFLSPMAKAKPQVAGLYSANTYGAVAGVVAATSWIVPRVGYSKALLAFAACNALSGALALAVESRSHSARHPEGAAAVPGALPLRLALTLLLTGMLGIGYEVLGVRVLAQALENTIYTFAAVLSVYLLGTAAGAAGYQRQSGALDADRCTGRLLLGLGAACATGVWILTRAPGLYQFVRASFGSSPARVWAAEFITAGAVFLLPTLLMGAACSHLLQLARRRYAALGRALAWNTMGSAAAPALFGVALLPLAGAKWSLAALVSLYCGLAWSWGGFPRWLLLGPLVLIGVLPGQLRHVDLAAGDTVAAYQEGVMDSVGVIEHRDGNRSLVVNNHFTMGGTGAAAAERRHASIPLLLHPRPRRALFLGLGTGITFAAAGAHPDLTADGVELEPEIVECFPWFAPHNTLPAAPGRFRIHIADARRFVRASSDEYDVIVADLFHPARDGAGALYSLEHYRAMRRRLAPDGIACQWLPLFQLGEPTLRVIIRTFLEAFPDTRAFLLRENVDTPVLGLIATLRPLRYGPDYFEQRVRDPGLRERLQSEQLRDIYHLLGGFVAGPEELRRFSGGAALNTDDHPVVLFEAPKFNLGGEAAPYGRLMRLMDAASSDPAVLVEPGSRLAAQLSDYIQARNIYLKGLVAEAQGKRDQAIDAYVESARASALFSTGYASALSIAMQEAKSNPPAARQLLERLAAARPDRPVATQLLKRLFGP